MFLEKLFSVLKNKENKENIENAFGSRFFFVLKNIKNKKNTRFRKHKNEGLFGFPFLNLFSALNNKKNKEKGKNKFGFQFFFSVLENKENTKLREQEHFSENTKIMLYVFKNRSQE